MDSNNLHEWYAYLMNYLQDKGLYYCLVDLCVFTNKAVIEKDNAGKDDAGKSEG